VTAGPGPIVWAAGDSVLGALGIVVESALGAAVGVGAGPPVVAVLLDFSGVGVVTTGPPKNEPCPECFM